MATAMKRMRPSQAAQALYRRAFGDRDGPRRGQAARLTDAEVEEYRRLVAVVCRNSRLWQRGLQPYILKDEGLCTHEEVVCEHCLRMVKTLLVKPSIISRHQNGDWVCANCDPRVATLLAMREMERLVMAG